MPSDLSRNLLNHHVFDNPSLRVAVLSPRGQTGGREGTFTKSWHESCYVTSHFCMEIYDASFRLSSGEGKATRLATIILEP